MNFVQFRQITEFFNIQLILEIVSITFIVLALLLLGLSLKDSYPEFYSPQFEQRLFGGIYNRIRHPQALSVILIWFSISLLLNSVLLLIITVISSVILYFITHQEEKDLIARFKEDYIRYKYLVPGFWLKFSYNWNFANELKKLESEIGELDFERENRVVNNMNHV
jgi:protein-S-isoprenylcysteine O-methyltransferase Ste14